MGNFASNTAISAPAICFFSFGIENMFLFLNKTTITVLFRWTLPELGK